MTVKVEVTPATFTLVSFDAAEIAGLTVRAAEMGGISTGSIRVDVDESVPLAMSKVTDGDPIVLWVEGGAFEDPRTVRKLSPHAVQTVAVRLLTRIADRHTPAFADAPPDDELSLPQLDAWDVWVLGRASRKGLGVNRQRWLYRFRNRHGFTDAADRAFEHLWSAETLTWSELVAICGETTGIR